MAAGGRIVIENASDRRTLVDPEGNEVDIVTFHLAYGSPTALGNAYRFAVNVAPSGGRDPFRPEREVPTEATCMGMWARLARSAAPTHGEHHDHVHASAAMWLVAELYGVADVEGDAGVLQAGTEGIAHRDGGGELAGCGGERVVDQTQR